MRERRRPLVDNPWAIIGLLFFVTLILGIPLLWMSRSFSTPVKLLLTVIICAHTALVVWGFWLIMVWSYGRIVDAL